MRRSMFSSSWLGMVRPVVLMACFAALFGVDFTEKFLRDAVAEMRTGEEKKVADLFDQVIILHTFGPGERGANLSSGFTGKKISVKELIRLNISIPDEAKAEALNKSVTISWTVNGGRKRQLRLFADDEQVTLEYSDCSTIKK